MREEENLPEGKESKGSNLKGTGKIHNYPGQVSTMFNRKKDVLSRWTEYGSELYNHEGYGNNADLTAISSQEEDIQTMLREEVEISCSTEKRRRLSKLIEGRS